MSRSLRIALAIASALAVLVAGCGDKGEESSDSASGGGSVKVGPGVTDKTITLGVLTDLSGVFAALAVPLTDANELYWKERNAQGGVCDRQVELVIKDHGYDPQKAVVQYRELGSKVAAFNQLLGSPITTALLPTLKQDTMLSILAAWPSSLLGEDFIIEVGAPYDIEIINGLDYLVEEGKLSEGDKIGHLYFEGEYGENGLLGSKAWAAETGSEVVEQKIQATDEDMSGQVAAFKRAGVKAIAVTTGPRQMASLAGIAASQGMKVAILGNNPTFDPAIMASPAAPALEATTYIVGSISPWTLDTPTVKKVGEDFIAANGEKDVKASVQFGYVQGQVMYEILNKACENKDLSRAGLVKAAHELSGVDTDGLVAGPLDYTKIGEPSTRAVYISQPSKTEAGGLKVLGDPLESETAKNYDPGAES